MSLFSTIINVLAGIFIIVAIILDFVAADRAKKSKNTDAEIAAIAAGVFAILGLLGIIIGAILGYVGSAGGSEADGNNAQLTQALELAALG